MKTDICEALLSAHYNTWRSGLVLHGQSPAKAATFIPLTSAAFQNARNMHLAHRKDKCHTKSAGHKHPHLRPHETFIRFQFR